MFVLSGTTPSSPSRCQFPFPFSPSLPPSLLPSFPPTYTVQEALEKAMKGRTTVVVAHR